MQKLTTVRLTGWQISLIFRNIANYFASSLALSGEKIDKLAIFNIPQRKSRQFIPDNKHSFTDIIISISTYYFKAL